VTDLDVRTATHDDWPDIWPFLRTIFAAGETYAVPVDVDEAAARAMWMPGPPWVTVVAERDGRVVGSAKTGPNREGPGAHVATASFAVDPSSSGRGAGRALGEHVLDLARAHGYRAMQFNAVVETNVRAVGLWRSLGFSVIGTVPEAFALPDGTCTGLHVMHRTL
jgi:L-amino acid N-acyltransferase YncA